MHININFPGLEGVILKEFRSFEDRVEIFVEMPVYTHRCPRCGTRTKNIHDYRIQKIRHLKLFERPSFLFYRKRRYKCINCAKNFYENNTIVDRYQRFSKEWNQAVNVRSVKASTFLEVSIQYGCSVSTVIRRFDTLAVRELKDTEELPTVISMDEYKGDTDAGKYQLIIADGDSREPLDILPNRRKKTIVDYLRKYGRNVGIVVMDMNWSFKEAVKKVLDRPIIVADHFHFCRYIFQALDKVRIRIQDTFNDYDRKRCKKMRHIFYKDSSQLNEKQLWYLNRYLSMSEELELAYYLKEEYCSWFKQAKENGAEKIKETKDGLHKFYKLVEDSGIEEFINALQTFKNWEIEILNSFVFPYNNGFLEGINNLTKVMKRNAHGFKNYERSRARILLKHKYKGIGDHIGS